MQHQKRIICSCSIGALATIVGVAAICLIPWIISTIAHSKMVLVPTNPSYPLWRDLDLPIYQKFYFYNVTNAHQVEHQGAKPALVEVGPFVFRLNLTKHNLTFDDDDTKLQFRENRRYYFDRNLSVSDLDVTLTTLNVPLAVAYDTIDFDSMNPFARLALKVILSEQSFFWNATPDELLFKGKTNIISCMASVMDPLHNPDCKFMYLRDQNDTDDGLYEIYTGYHDAARINSIISLNGSDKLDTWDGDQCNDISGTSNGELFPPLDTLTGENANMLHFFRSDFCRVFNLTLNRANIPSNVRSDLLVDRFTPVKDIFANSSVNPANECYRPNTNRTRFEVKDTRSTTEKLVDFLRKNQLFDKLLTQLGSNQSQVMESLMESPPKFKPKPQPERPSGVFDLSACHDGVPILISWPHFYDADPYYLSFVTGLKPNVSKHRTYIDVHPLTGTPVDFLARLQVNIDVQTKLAEKVRMESLVFPTFWQEFSIEITDAMAQQITSETRTPRIIAFTIASLVTVAGVCLVLYGALLIFIHLHRKRLAKSEQPLLSEEDDSDQSHEDGSGGGGHLDRDDSTNNNSMIN